MCGLVGIFGNITQEDKKIFQMMLVASSIRGPHSTGVGFSTDSTSGKVGLTKIADDPWALIRTDEYKKAYESSFLSSPFLMGHNRWATVGNITSQNAHPFLHGRILLAHNGGVRNHRLLTKKDFDVDSEHVAWLFNDKGARFALEQLEGDFVFTWWDIKDRTFSIVRNDGRPIWISKNTKRNTWYYASEEWMIIAACLRQGQIVTEPIQPEPGIVVSWNTECNKWGKLYTAKHKLAPKVVVGGNHWDAVGDEYNWYGGGERRRRNDPVVCSAEEFAKSGGRSTNAGRALSAPAANALQSSLVLAGGTHYVSPDRDIQKGRKFLETHGLVLGDWLRGFFYMFDEYEKLKHEKKRGRVSGLAWEDDAKCNINLLAHNVNLENHLDKVGKDFLEGWYAGTIENCWYDSTVDEYYITLNSFTQSPEDPAERIGLRHKEILKPVIRETTRAPLSPAAPRTSATDVTAERLAAITATGRGSPLVPLPESTDDEIVQQQGETMYVPGPRGILISESEWRRLVKTGCNLCSDPIDEDDFLKIAFDEASYPYCEDCIKRVNSEGGKATWGMTLIPVGAAFPQERKRVH